MEAVEKFLRQNAYKFPKGYPDMNNPKDIILLESLLKEIGIDLKPKSVNETPAVSKATKKSQDLERIVKIVDKEDDEKITKIQLFDILAEFTYKYYDKELGDIKEVFPTPATTIKNWKGYVSKTESNNGKEVEQALEAYTNEQGVEASSVRGKGTDITIGGKEVEIKSSNGNKIVTMLQTSFYKNDPNKFYAFVTNTGTKDITVRIVSSQLLYRLSLGDDIADELNLKGTSEKLLKQIKDGLNTLDFPHFIQTSIVTGESANMGKSFMIGKNIKVRFVIYIEPR